jgi:hypothetical protein
MLPITGTVDLSELYSDIQYNIGVLRQVVTHDLQVQKGRDADSETKRREILDRLDSMELSLRLNTLSV